MAGLFITFEGTEGSGKTTQALLLAEYLTRQGYEVVSTREPGGTDIGCGLRDILLTSRADGISARTELFLYCADRAHHIQSVVLPALEDGKCVICDRFSDATVAYQGWGRGLELEEVNRVCSLAAGGIIPDMSILLDIDPAEGLGRAIGRNEKNRSAEDRYEKEDLDFHRRVRQGYLAQADAEPDRFRIVSSCGTAQEIQRRVVEVMIDIIKAHPST